MAQLSASVRRPGSGQWRGGPGGALAICTSPGDMSSTDREAALWEMEEHHLQERHQLVKQQLKDQYFLQRHELVRKHEKVRLLVSLGSGAATGRPGRAARLPLSGASLAPESSQVGHSEARELLERCPASDPGARNWGNWQGSRWPKQLPR